MAQIIHITHDDGTFSEYDSAPSSRLTVEVAAGLNSTAEGLERNNTGSAGDGQVAINLSTATTVFRLGYYIDLNTFSPNSGQGSDLVYLQGDSAGYTFFTELRDDGSGIFFRVRTQEDDFGEVNLSTTAGGLPSGEVTVEVVWTKASSAVANDGVCEILINSIQANIVSNLDMFNSWADIAASLTALIISTDGYTGSGTFYYDEIIIRDDSTSIFPVFSGFDLVIGGGQV